jgi:D-3-phosphoglycerate dehydrogenase
MKVLVADKLPESNLQALRDAGHQVVFEPGLSATDLPDAIEGMHILVVRSTKVTSDAIHASKHLQLIIRAGAGTNTIDSHAAAQKAIHVANCPGKNAVAVAELTMGLVLSLDRFIPDSVISLREGQWEKGRFGKGQGLLGRTFGIIGMGRIGQEVAQRARAFGMRVIASSRSLTPEKAQALGVEYRESALDVCRDSDVVSVHVAYSDETHHLISTPEFNAMKEGAFLVHMARGGVVDDKALYAAVNSGKIRAASDVFEDEPKGGKSEYQGPFKDLQGFYGTHHVGASTEQSQQAIGDEVLRIVNHWTRTGDVLNCVNRSGRGEGHGQMLIRHLDRVGVLAAILEVIKGNGISVKQMQNTIFDGTGAATAAITLDREPEQAVIESVRRCCDDVLGVEWVAFR